MSSPSAIAIIDYGSGNLRSAAKAFERSVRESGLDMRVLVTREPQQVRTADRIVLPGVGAFGDCMAGLNAIEGMVDVLRETVINGGRPFMGICVGMQLMASIGIEHGQHAGLGWIAGRVEMITPDDPALKIPHMGWNTLRVMQDHRLFEGLQDDAHVYFVHSNHFIPDDPGHCLAVSDYGGAITAIIGRDNLIGTQFHPEKSQVAGIGLIGNFLKWTP